MLSKYFSYAIHLLLYPAILGYVVQAQADGDTLSFPRDTNEERDISPPVVPKEAADVANDPRGPDIIIEFDAREIEGEEDFPMLGEGKRSPKKKGGSTGGSNSTANNDEDDSAAAVVGISAMAPFAISLCLLATMGWLGT